MVGWKRGSLVHTSDPEWEGSGACHLLLLLSYSLPPPCPQRHSRVRALSVVRESLLLVFLPTRLSSWVENRCEEGKNRLLLLSRLVELNGMGVSGERRRRS